MKACSSTLFGMNQMHYNTKRKVGADAGYWTTQHINVNKPFTVPEVEAAYLR